MQNIDLSEIKNYYSPEELAKINGYIITIQKSSDNEASDSIKRVIELSTQTFKKFLSIKEEIVPKTEKERYVFDYIYNKSLDSVKGHLINVLELVVNTIPNNDTSSHSE